MTAEQLQIWGVLPDEDEQSDLASIARTWAGLVTPPADESVYPYRVSTADGRSESGTATDPDAIAGAFESAVAGRVRVVRDGRTVQFGSLPVTVSLYAPEQFHLAPAWEVWIDAALLRDTDESVVSKRHEEIVSLATEAHDTTGALFTFAHATTGPYDPSIHPGRTALLQGDLSPLAWLSILSPALVERVGRDQLLTVPVGDVEEQNDGTVALRAFDDPLERDVERLRAIERHLEAGGSGGA